MITELLFIILINCCYIGEIRKSRMTTEDSSTMLKRKYVVDEAQDILQEIWLNGMGENIAPNREITC